MADVALSKLISDGGLPKLAPDLDFPSQSFSSGFKTLSFTPAGSLTTVLSLTGKWAISTLALFGMTAETHTIKLTVDGVVIWDSTYVTGTSQMLLGFSSSSNILNSANDTVIKCGSSFLLEVQSATDNDEVLYYNARPIL